MPICLLPPFASRAASPACHVRHSAWRIDTRNDVAPVPLEVRGRIAIARSPRYVWRRFVVPVAGGDRSDRSVVADKLQRPADWEEFGAHVSGEWDGYMAEFNFMGEPLQLPSNVVPDAFHDWGREVHDWQTQCSTLAHPEKGHFAYKDIKLVPTVGCEEDAVTVYGVEKCDVQRDASMLAYHGSGSYTITWRGNRVENESSHGPGKEVIREGDDLEVEQCLVHEQSRTRIRVCQHLRMRRHIRVFREAWEGPFRNGESLGGCAVGTAGFATEKPLHVSSLSGFWHAMLYSSNSLQNQLVKQQMCKTGGLSFSGEEIFERTLADSFLFLCLPKDMWTLLTRTDSGGTLVETGWLVNPDQCIVSRCEFEESGILKGVCLRHEKRLSAEEATRRGGSLRTSDWQDIEECIDEE
ncbi:uncharacterized protein [Physcomitrium patens]|uniref:Uncharacterized protein n=2 Tax=Physcomitrium patens TaxID=3218 RepID=A0A2K1L083_PHYPA|nr:uncharacterized protein LOC112295161 isoform X2 [Physcomitrium patens]PNR59430.1 hypothetical protein PHYPA_002221 [Physcomitrium patens]|eukprot:XP_024402159.1 uncharacterized protein LOC112295161 isoform X2 [Physcomitrella patens]